MSFLGVLGGTLLGGLVDYGANSALMNQQSGLSYENNAALQSSAQGFASNMYAKSFSDQRAENRWQWSEAKAENRWMWEQKKREARYWADFGKLHEVTALRRAGLNPILAATGGLRGVSIPAMNQSSASPAGGQKPNIPGVSSNSASVAGAQIRLNLMENVARIALLKKQGRQIDSVTAANLVKAQGGEIENAAKSIKLRQDKIEDNYKSGEKGAIWKYGIAPLKSIVDLFGPASKWFTKGK